MNKKRLARIWMDIAERMMLCGAEIYRVEEALERLGKAYGAKEADVFVITNSIVCTFIYDDDETYTISRRVRGSVSTDFIKLEKLNALVRHTCKNPISETELENAVKEASVMPPFVKTTIGGVISAAAFTLFFSGSWLESIFAAIFGLVICLMQKYCGKMRRVSLYMIASLLTGVLICLCGILLPGLHVDKIIVGVIMLTIPGIATTNAIRDILIGDTLSGSLRLIQSLLEALIIAGSYMCATRITQVNVEYAASADGIWQLIPAFFGSLGFALMFNSKIKFAFIGSLCGMLCWAMFLLAELKLGAGIFWCALAAACFGDVMAENLARILKAPATLFLIPIVIPLIPGCSLFYAVNAFMEESGSLYATNTFLMVVGIALGVGISASIFTAFRKRKS